MRPIIINVLIGLVLAATTAWAQTESSDPPSRIARLAYLQGGVSFRPAGADEWVDPGLNRPLTVGDQLWSDRGGRIEMQLDGSNVRLGTETSASILNLIDETTQLQLSSGSMIVHVQQLEDDESYEIDTPNVAFSILRAGTYRLTVDPDGQSTAIAVRRGQGEAVGGNGVGYTVRAGEYQTFAGADELEADNAPMAAQDEFDDWSAERDNRFDHSESAQYVSPDVVGYEELDSQGSWDDTPDYGHVWFPTTVQAGWAPYHYGHWAYVAPWGYTWVDDRPWGFAPFHYGRWVYWRQRWGWVPAPPRAPNGVYVRPVYAPALVAWVGAGATLGWFPLAPREVFVPSYPVSRRYLNVVNVSNTRINTTVINNVYNTTIVNRTTINNVTYANRGVPGAVISTNSQTFANARPIRGNQGSVDRQAIANAPVRAFAPAVVPERAAVYGGRGIANVRPPQAVQTRSTAARMAPAAAAPSIDQRLQALRENRGRAPNPAQLSRAPAQAAPQAPNVRVVPPVRTLVNSQQLETAARAQASQNPPAQVGSAARPAVHANELPSGARGPSPAVANSVLDRQQAQEQQRLQASQEGERQRIQQQQDLEHRRQATQQAGDLRRQQLEQQRNAQNQAQTQAQAELQRTQQVQQQRSAQLQQLQQQQAQEQQRQNQGQVQAQQQAEQQRAQQVQQQRQLEQQVQQQRSAQLEQQQRAQQVEQQRQAQIQAQAQQQAQQQRNQQLERQREAQQAQVQRQQETQRQIETQHQQQTLQLQQQQARAQQEMQQRQQAAQAQQQQQQQQQQNRRPSPPNQRQP